MHVCFVNMPIEYYSPISGGAIATIIAKTAEELILAEHKVTVLTPTNDDPIYQSGDVRRIVTKQRSELSFLSRRISDLRRRLRRWDWPYFEFYLNALKRRLSELDHADVVVLFNDLFSPPEVRKVLPSVRIAVWLQNECRTHPNNIQATVVATDVFLCCSSYISDWTSKTHNVAPDKFAVVPSGADLKALLPRADFLVAKEPVRVLFIGRIDRNKGPDIVADVVGTLQAEGLAVELTVAGGLWFYGSQDPMSDSFFRELNVKMKNARANYLGHVVRADVPELIRGHDIVCVLSRSNEPFGLVTLEAMASGCVVVASNRGGLPEACGGAAVLVDPDDSSAVVAALRRLIADPMALADAKRRSIQRASKASWSVTANRFIDAVSSVRAC